MLNGPAMRLTRCPGMDANKAVFFLNSSCSEKINGSARLVVNPKFKISRVILAAQHPDEIQRRFDIMPSKIRSLPQFIVEKESFSIGIAAVGTFGADDAKKDEHFKRAHPGMDIVKINGDIEF